MKSEDFVRELNKVVNSLPNSVVRKEIMQKLGDFAVGLIKKRTRLGYGVPKHKSSKSKLDPLSKGYKKQRKKLKLDSTTTANKSNLTQTGHMLDSLEAQSKKEVTTIGFNDDFALKKAGWNADKGRPFNHLSNAEIKQCYEFLKKIVEDIIMKELSKIGK